MKSSDVTFSKRFVYRLRQSIDTECLTYRDYIPWADRVVERCAHPPLWIADLSVTKYRPDAVRILDQEAFGEPFESFEDMAAGVLGFLWMRYQRREISWASFLREAGNRSDGTPCGVECEYFYALLNDYEASEFDEGIEQRQRGQVEADLSSPIDEARQFVRLMKEDGEPGATDNPDDAQRFREDH